MLLTVTSRDGDSELHHTISTGTFPIFREKERLTNYNGRDVKADPVVGI